MLVNTPPKRMGLQDGQGAEASAEGNAAQPNGAAAAGPAAMDGAAPDAVPQLALDLLEQVSSSVTCCTCPAVPTLEAMVDVNPAAISAPEAVPQLALLAACECVTP